MKTFLNAQEVADLFGYKSLMQVYRLVDAGILPATQLSERAHLKFFSKSVYAVLKKKTTNPHLMPTIEEL